MQTTKGRTMKPKGFRTYYLARTCAILMSAIVLILGMASIGAGAVTGSLALVPIGAFFSFIGVICLACAVEDE